MEATSVSSLNYLRAVQQLQKKTEELERVFDEARRLEREKAVLAEKNAALLQEVAELEAQNNEWRAEFTVLEQQVRQQQLHLQAQIEREADRLQKEKNKEKERSSSAKDRESESLLILQQQQQQQQQQQERLREGLEAAKTENANLTAKCRTLTREAAELRRELKTAKAQAAHYRSTHARAAAEGAAIDEIESKALQGVKSELTAFAEENERLMNELQAERRARGVAEEGLDNLQILLQRQREASERQQLIAKQELQALNVQNDALLEDIRRLMSREAEYDSNYNNNNNNNNNNSDSNMATTPQHRSYFSVDRGTMTTEVFYTSVKSLPMMTTATTTTSSSSSLAIEGGRGTRLELGSNGLELQLRELQEKIHMLKDMIITQERVIQEKEANEKLLEERAKLLVEERRHLRAVLENSVTSERLEEHRDSSNIVRAVADTELGTILEAVVDVLRHLVNSTSQLRARLFHQSMGIIESNVLPVVPCREYTSPHLNAIFSHLGGIRHIADLIDQLGVEKLTQEEQEAKVQKQQHQQQKQKKLSSIVSTLNQEPNLLTTTVNLNSHDTSHNSTQESSTHSTSNTTTVRNISAWLAARQNNLKEQLQQPNSSNKDESKQTHFSAYKYQSGETLIDAARELYSQSYRKSKQTSQK